MFLTIDISFWHFKKLCSISLNENPHWLCCSSKWHDGKGLFNIVRIFRGNLGNLFHIGLRNVDKNFLYSLDGRSIEYLLYFVRNISIAFYSILKNHFGIWLSIFHKYYRIHFTKLHYHNVLFRIILIEVFMLKYSILYSEVCSFYFHVFSNNDDDVECES